MSEKPQPDPKQPAKPPHVPAYNPDSKLSASDLQNNQPNHESNGVASADPQTSDVVRRTPTFYVVHDPSPHPLSSDRGMTKYEVQFGLRYNTFTKGTIIKDIVTGSRHEVITKNVFKPTLKGGMLAFIESYLDPPHPIINPRSYTKDGKYID
jgi:hypothetical protein